MSEHPLKLREAVNVAEFNRREELFERLWTMKERVRKHIADIAKWNAANPDQPISDAFEWAMLDYLNGHRPMPTVPEITPTEPRDDE